MKLKIRPCPQCKHENRPEFAIDSQGKDWWIYECKKCGKFRFKKVGLREKSYSGFNMEVNEYEQ